MDAKFHSTDPRKTDEHRTKIAELEQDIERYKEELDRTPSKKGRANLRNGIEVAEGVIARLRADMPREVVDEDSAVSEVLQDMRDRAAVLRGARKEFAESVLRNGIVDASAWAEDFAINDYMGQLIGEVVAIAEAALKRGLISLAQLRAILEERAGVYRGKLIDNDFAHSGGAYHRAADAIKAEATSRALRSEFSSFASFIRFFEGKLPDEDFVPPCPGCSSQQATIERYPDGSVTYACHTCGGIHGRVSRQVGESIVDERWIDDAHLPDAQTRYFDFTLTDGGADYTRRHGWYDTRTGTIMQTG